MLKNKRLICRVILILIGVYFVVKFISVRFSLDYDLIWHYMLGRDIVETGTISIQNNYSWIQGTYWNQHEWLFDLCFYWIVSKTGSVGFILCYTLCIAALFFMGITYNKNEIKSYLFYLIASLFVFMSVPMNNMNRPSDYSTLAVPFLIIYGTKLKHRWISCIVYFVTGIFICNFHCGQGIAILAMMLLYFGLDFVSDSIFKSRRGERHIIGIVFVACYIVGLISTNPKQIFDLFTVLHMESTKYIQEWGHLPMTNILTVATFALIFISTVFDFIKNKDKKSFMNFGIMLVTGVISILSAKASILYVYSFVIFGYTSLERMIFSINGSDDMMEMEHRRIIIIPATAGLLISLLVLKPFNITYNELVEKEASCLIESDMISYLKQYPDAKLLHDYNVSNFLMWNGIKVIVDTRQQPYATEIGYTQTCDDVFHLMYEDLSDEEIERILDKYDINVVLSSKYMDLSEYLSKSDLWKLEICDKYNNEIWVKMEVE